MRAPAGSEVTDISPNPPVDPRQPDNNSTNTTTNNGALRTSNLLRASDARDALRTRDVRHASDTPRTTNELRFIRCLHHFAPLAGGVRWFFLRRRPSRRSLEARTWRPCVHPVIKAHEIQ